MSRSLGGDAEPAGVPISIVGMSCKVPGAATPESFWSLLADGAETVTDVPPGRGHSSSARRAGFVEGIAEFDAEFFGISPNAARMMDPQQRLLLELAWEALEDARIVPRSGEEGVGVFIGSMWSDYALLAHERDGAILDQHTLPGTNRGMIANRLSYFLDARGPSFSVDCAHSSSLAAVHLAVQSLRRGECSLAVAGGVNVNLSAFSERALDRLGVFSPEGRCFVFDERASGYVRGEGAGLVILKRSDAVDAARDKVYAEILSSVVNHGGGDTLTRPSATAQRDLLTAACREAGIDASEVQYVELHAAGTPAGDPVEAQALGDVLGGARDPGDPLLVGSVKTNIGHLEGAAGIAGLLKVALALKHRELPPTLHHQTAHRDIPLDELNLRVCTTRRGWPRPDRPLLCGVSSFGIGGTNCHLVLRDTPRATAGPPASAPDETSSRPAPLVISARSDAALRAQAGNLREQLLRQPEVPLEHVAYSLATTRTLFEHRAVAVAADRETLARDLGEFAVHNPAGSLTAGLVSGEHRVAVVFSGQGGQYAGMGRELYLAYEEFASAFDAACLELDRHLDRPLKDVIFAAAGGAGELDQTKYTQPALFAVEYATMRLLREWGLSADFLAGHSIGEITAAHVAGMMSLPDAALLVATRGRLMQEARPDGAMYAVEATEQEALAELAGHDGAVSVASINAPTGTVISGDTTAVEAIAARFDALGRRTTPLRTSHAFHSPHMDSVLERLEATAATIAYLPPRVPVVSAVTADVLSAMDAAYWSRHARAEVRFLDAVRRMEDLGVTSFIEVGPGAKLVPMLRECLSGRAAGRTVMPTLRAVGSDSRRLLTAMATVHVQGGAFDIGAALGRARVRTVDLPVYPFQRKRFWLPRVGTAVAADAPSPVAGRSTTAGDAATPRTTDPLEIVRGHAARILGHADAHEVDPDRTFKDLGFDSAATVEFFDAVGRSAGIPLSGALAFEYPTPRSLAAYLADSRPPEGSTPPPPPESEADGDPVAVVAMACRAPGGVTTPEELWDLLEAGRDAVTAMPADRGWDLNSLVSPRGRERTTCATAGGFLDDAAGFDAEFFGISPREALAMDPQQRQLLEVSWEAVERAGIDPASLRDSPTGVFVGATTMEYGPRMAEADDDTAGFVLTGTAPSMLSGRVAYELGTRGPALTVDTACSASLVAVHLAAQALRNDECELALAGGVAVMSTPGMFVEFARQHGLAPDGRCKAFSASADGTGWAEAAGVVVLERLSRARALGHPVLATIRGSAVNQDGASNGLTAPNGRSQEAVIEDALTAAGLNAADVDAIEAHGTGTALGDPVEANAVLRTYGRDRDPRRPAWLGSVKSNLGHAQAAAGVIGLVKMVLALRHELLPRSLHITEPSPHPDWASGRIELLTRPVGWPRQQRVRRAAVSSFGISGTNCHLILEESPEEHAPVAGRDDAGRPAALVPCVLSAASPQALREWAARLRRTAAEHDPADIAHALATTRAAFGYRAVVLAADRAQLLSGLDAVASGQPHPRAVTGRVRRGSEEERRAQAAADALSSDAAPEALADAYVRGARLAWDRVLRAPVRRVDLPTYPFQHTRYWPRTPAAASAPPRRDDLGVLLYQSTWDHVSPAARALSGRWLIVAPAERADDELVQVVCRGLSRGGARAELIAIPAGCDRSGVRERLAAAVAGGRADGVLSLLDVSPGEPLLLARPELPPAGLNLLQALLDEDIEAPVWQVTRQSVTTGPEDPPADPLGARTWALGHTLRHESPQHWGGLIDLPSALDERAIEDLRAVLAGGGEDEAAIRPSGVFARRLAPVPATGLPERPWRPRGTTLITGGTGALGGHLAKWLARRGAEHLLLVSRSGRDADGAAALEAELSALGSAVTIAACDVTDRAELSKVIAAVPRRHPLSAVVHVAGTHGAAPLRELTARRWSEVTRTKVLGAVNLHELTQGRQLTRFIVYSSVMAVLGQAVQGAYAAANAFVDALVRYRLARRLPGTSLMWGPWKGDGFGASLDERTWHSLGLTPTEPTTLLDIFDHLDDSDRASLIVADIDWNQYGGYFGESGLLRGLARPRDAGIEPKELRARLQGSSAAEQRRILTELVRTRAAHVLGHQDRAAISKNDEFESLGLTSMTAVRLRDELNTATGLRLPTGLAYNCPTPGAVAEYLLRSMSDSSGEKRDRRDRLAPVSPPAAHPGPENGDAANAPKSTAPTTPAAAPEPALRERDDIAIVGMACRLPGDICDPEALWDLLVRGGDVTSDIPADRGWDLTRFADADAGTPRSSYCRRGGFLSGPDLFDADFFGISPREALAMDPQQRILLELAWEAVERTGIDPASLRSSETGVYLGLQHETYGAEQTAEDSVEGYVVTGTAGSVGSGRIAYCLGLEGPAVTVDTACSSSLAAVHLAVRSLRHGECAMALAGGVTVMPGPRTFFEFSRQRGLAPDGRCKPFSDRADGMALAEGAGIVVLEPLSRARERGRRILAVVRGTALNQDGATNGLTAPSGAAQERVIRKALADARLDARDIDAVEAHGTGTRLGDPIEAEALQTVYGEGRADDRPLWIGSVKSNLGHTQAAAGVVGVIKTVLAMNAGLLPRSLHIDRPSSQVEWNRAAVRPLVEAVPWPRTNGAPRRAGVSSFGISGTNAHAILELPEPSTTSARETRTAPDENSPVLPVLVSGHSPRALAAQADRLRAHLVDRPDLSLPDIAFSTATSRAHLEYRAAVLVENRTQLIDALGMLRDGDDSAHTVTGRASAPPVVFVFPGDGSRWPGEALNSLRSCPAFARRLRECDEALREHLGWSVLEVLDGSPRAVGPDPEEVAAPAHFAMMVSLAAALGSLGVTPTAVLGHSHGEIAAAVVAEALSLADGARVVASRSRACRTLAGRGAMAAVRTSEPGDDVVPARLASRINVAATNGPRHLAVSGDRDAVQDFVRACDGVKVGATLLPHAFAAHSPHVEPARDQVVHDLRDIAARTREATFYSTVTGGLLPGGRALDGEYWFSNLRRTTRFRQAFEALLDDEYRLFLQLGPDPVLSEALSDTTELRDVRTYLGDCTAREAASMSRLVTSVAELYAHGADIDWETAFAGRAAARVDLPAYAFQRSSYWIPLAQHSDSQSAADAGLEPAAHPMLSAAVRLDDGTLLFTTRFDISAHPWLRDHLVQQEILMPGTAFVELAAYAAAESGLQRIDELVIQKPLVLAEDQAVDLRVLADAPGRDGRRTLRIQSRPARAPGEWSTHAQGRLSADGPSEQPETAPPAAGTDDIDVEELYSRFASAGIDFGSSFRVVRRMRHGTGEVFAEVALNAGESGDAESFLLHPALLDGALQGSSLLGAGQASLPFVYSGVRIFVAKAARVRARLTAIAPEEVRVVLFGDSEEVVAVIESLRLRPPAAAGAQAGGALYALRWHPAAVPPGPAPTSPRIAVLTSAADRVRPVPAALPVVEYPNPRALRTAVEQGAPAPGLILAPVHTLSWIPETGADPAAVHEVVQHTLALIQLVLGTGALSDTTLAVLTRGAVSVAGEEVTDVGGSGVWGLLRSAQTEHPGRIVAIDLDPARDLLDVGLVARWCRSAEPQLAERGSDVLVPGLAAVSPASTAPPGDTTWKLTARGTTVDELVFESADSTRRLGPGEVRVGVRAAGLNFHDVVTALGVVRDGSGIGAECSGIVLEVGEQVADLHPGDRVTGLAADAFAPVVTTDRRLLTEIPPGLGFAEAAAIPAVFATAYYALHDLGGIAAGDRILVHAAAGGVGSAAAQLATLAGAEVYGTANPAKWDHLRARGFADDHLASSRTLEFAGKFSDGPAGARFDIVVNSLAGAAVESSLGLLKNGGRFIELGKTDLRDPKTVSKTHPGVSYRHFDLNEVPVERRGEILRTVTDLFRRGALTPPPLRVWDIADAARAFRHLRDGSGIGKNVLTIPRKFAKPGTVLITGGTGALGRTLARHLVAGHGVSDLVLASRTGPDAEGIGELVSELTRHGAEVRVERCDASDRAALAGLVDSIPAARPLTAVVHAAGVLEDGVVSDLDAAAVDRVLSAKIDGALHLDSLTEGHDLAAFIVYSSAAGTLGTAGQAGYAAANAALDGLVRRRRARGLPAVSLGWGLWEHRTGMTRNLDGRDLDRLAGLGIGTLSDATALRLFDQALGLGEPHPLPMNLDLARAARRPAPHPLLRDLLRARVPSPTGSDADVSRASFSGQDDLLDLVYAKTAAVLGRNSTSDLLPDRPFKNLGFDSLAAVELGNSLSGATGLALPATLVFDCPTPESVARYLAERLRPDGSDAARHPAEPVPGRRETVDADADGDIEAADSDEELFAILDIELGGDDGQR